MPLRIHLYPGRWGEEADGRHFPSPETPQVAGIRGERRLSGHGLVALPPGSMTQSRTHELPSERHGFSLG